MITITNQEHVKLKIKLNESVNPHKMIMKEIFRFMQFLYPHI